MSPFARPLRRRGGARAKATRLGLLLERAYPRSEDWPIIRVYGVWMRTLPKRVVQNALPVRLERGTLWVHVTSPVWAQELSFLERDLLEKLKRVPGAAVVRTIRFRVGPLPEVRPLEDPTGPGPAPRARARKRVPDLVLDAALSRVGDPDLREAVERAIEASLGRLPPR